MARKKHHESHSRREHEMRMSGMISENRSEVANMPQEVRYHAWPKSQEGMYAKLDDTISGIDRQMDMDHSKARRDMDPTKY